VGDGVAAGAVGAIGAVCGSCAFATGWIVTDSAINNTNAENFMEIPG